MQNRKVGQPTSFSIQPLSWKPSYGADSTTLVVTFNKPWEYVSGETSWLTVSKKSGGSEVKEPDTEEITLNVTENTSASSSRSATLLFRSEEVEVRVSVEQAKHDAYTISINPTSISLENTSGSAKAVTVTANQSWTITGAPEWLGVSKSTGSGNDTVTFTTQSANSGAEGRTGTITFTGSQSGSATLSVTQAGQGYNLSVNPTSKTIEGKGGSFDITVTSNDTWSASSNQTWATVKTSGNTVTVTVTEYTGDSARNATISFTGSHGTSATCSITQSAAQITYGDPVVTINYSKPESPDAPADGDDTVLVVSFTQTWGYNGATTGGGSIEWATGDDPIGFDIEWFGGAGGWDGDYAYISGDSLGTTPKARTKIADVYCTVTINGKTGTSNTLEIYQEENKVESVTFTQGYLSKLEGSSGDFDAPFVAGSSISIDANSGQASASIAVVAAVAINAKYTSNATDTIYPEDILNGVKTAPGDISWSGVEFSNATMAPDGAYGFPDQPMVGVTIDENKTNLVRSGVLEGDLQVGDLGSDHFSWSITQAKADNYLNVNPDSLSFEASGGSQEIKIDTNESWTIE